MAKKTFKEFLKETRDFVRRFSTSCSVIIPAVEKGTLKHLEIRTTLFDNISSARKICNYFRKAGKRIKEGEVEGLSVVDYFIEFKSIKSSSPLRFDYFQISFVLTLRALPELIFINKSQKPLKRIEEVYHPADLKLI